MAISGTQKALTPARSGLARSGATRAGWPLVVGRLVRLYALSGVARSDATRSNYTAPTGFVALGGVAIGTAPVLETDRIVGDLTITDQLMDTPNRATFRVRGMIPAIGQDVVITLGSTHTLSRLFAGQVLTVSQGYTGTPANYYHDVSAIDWTWNLRQRLIGRRWRQVSGTTIAQDILAAGAPGYSSQYVAANLQTLDEFTVTNVDAPAALSQLAKRLGAQWYIDEFRRLHFYTDADPFPVTPPQPINPAHPTLKALIVDRDGSQLVTRVYVEAGGSVAHTEIAPGETLIPVVTAAWYETGGGVVLVGPDRVSYGGVRLGGSGTLVGPGAQPSAPPSALVTAGTGIEAGAHDYAVTFVTAGGESLPGPRRTVTVGTIEPPASAPIVQAIVAGIGPDPGTHSWVVTYVTAGGETLAGPAVSATIPPSLDPVSAPVPGASQYGGSIPAGTYQYVVTFETSSGETAPGPASTPATMVSPPVSPPTSAPTGTGVQLGNLPTGTYQYMVTFVTGAGGDTGYQSGVTPVSAPIAVPAPNGQITLAAIPTSPSATVTHRRIYRQRTTTPAYGWLFVATIADNVTTSYTDNVTDGALGSGPSGSNTALGPTHNARPVTVPTGPSGTQKRHLYRSAGGVYGKVATLANNTTTEVLDTVSAAGLGPAPPGVSTASPRQVQLRAIPTGGIDVQSRRLYRTRAGAATYGLVLTIADNATTTATDTIADSGLGAAPPAVSTASAQRVQLAAIPIGSSTVTARKVYRSKAGLTALQLLTTIGDNTTTSYLDAAADATLGAAVPTQDTSGLQQPPGLVAAGASEIVVAGTAAFAASGGWVVIGNGQQVIRYTGITGNRLTGVPTSGDGAITASIAYNSTITAAPTLTGVPASGPGAIVTRIPKGQDLNLWIQVDDPEAQAAVAALFSSAEAGAHSGILEEVIQDRRLSAAEARARGRAHLTERRQVQIRLRFETQDLNTRSGRRITVSLLGAPYYLSAEFLIQSVTMRRFAPAVRPTFTVEAASKLFTFEDLLRRVHLQDSAIRTTGGE